MATALHMQLPHRPSMDRPPSSDQSRPRSTPPFASPYDHAPSPSVRPIHSRSSSIASNSPTSPYQQPYPPTYFPQTNQMYSVQPQAWSTTALPASALYQPQLQAYQNQPVFHQGFQQSQADFAAWSIAYQQMVMASAAGRGMSTPPMDYQGERRRTNSGPQGHHHSQSYHDYGPPHLVAQPPPEHNFDVKQPQPYHKHQRGLSHRPSPESMRMPRSTSQPAMSSTLEQLSPSSSLSSTRTPPTSSDHHRTSSSDSSVLSIGTRTETEVKKEELSSGSPASRPTASANVLTKALSSTPTIRAVPTPLHTGPIANATNSIPPAANRSSPLSQSSMAASPEPTEKMMKTGGLKGRLKKALEKDSKREAKTSTPSPPARSTPISAPRPVFTSPSETSTRSATPPTTPSQDFPAPSAPFAIPAAMGSDVSLAGTEATATAPSELTREKGKRSLFRMKNMSTDNISLASTVSSASMMIRKMGSIGKIARRNSLMGISRIFKDKPKDEDAALPEKDAKKKDKKNKMGKAEIAPAAISHATAELDRISEDEDRALAGLSPAAKLARQHTLRSKAGAEAANKDADNAAAPTWDQNTAPRQQQLLPSIKSVTGPEVVHVTPRQAPTIVHAVAVSEHEYDSEDESSEGETVEDATISMGRTRLSDEADAEFQAVWGNGHIDRYAVPKKGILKNITSIENFEAKASRHRANSAAQTSFSRPGALSQPPSDASQIDGLYHPLPLFPTHEGFHSSVARFDSPEFGNFEFTFPYQTPSMNTSAPTLHFVGSTKPTTPRSMTAPARRRLLWAPECAVYSTYDAGTYDRRSEPATCNRLTPQLALAIKQELNAFKKEMPVHPASQGYTHYFA